MKKSKKPRPVSPCWYCGTTNTEHRRLLIPIVELASWDRPLRFNDVRDVDWYWCYNCNATTCYNPISLGPGPKIMPWGAFTELVNNLYTGIDITARSILETTRKKKLI